MELICICFIWSSSGKVSLARTTLSVKINRGGNPKTVSDKNLLAFVKMVPSLASKEIVVQLSVSLKTVIRQLKNWLFAKVDFYQNLTI